MSIAWNIEVFGSLPTTQDALKDRAEEPQGLVLQALTQTMGKGRHGNQWDSPMGNLYMSVLLKPDCSADEAAQLSFVSAVALSAAMDEVLDKEEHVKTLKWPNDVLIDGKKCAGILIEREGDSYVLGIGVNIMAPPEGRVGLQEVSWEIQVPVHPFRDKVLNHLNIFYTQWQKDGFAPLRKRWLKQAHGMGKPLTVRLPNETIQGTFKDLDKSGALMLTMPDGSERRINAGEVHFAPEY